MISDGKDWTVNVPEIEFPFLQRIYGFYANSGNVQNKHLPSEGHDYGLSKRKAMYEFLTTAFGMSVDKFKNQNGELEESGVTIEKEAALKVFGADGTQLPGNAVKGLNAISKVFEEAIKR